MTGTYLDQHQWAQVAFGISVAAFVAGELGQVVRLRRGATVSSVTAELVFRLVFFTALVMLPLAQTLCPHAVFGGGAAVFVGGMVVGWAGLSLRWWAFAVLGRYFTTVVKATADQQVVDRGPYRLLRHPSYSGLLLVVLGCGLMLGNWAGTIACVVLTLVGLIYRLSREEKAMTAALGETYGRFVRSRARLVPFVW